MTCALAVQVSDSRNAVSHEVCFDGSNRDDFFLESNFAPPGYLVLTKIFKGAQVTERVHYHDELIFTVGTKVVTLRDIKSASGTLLQARGSVGAVVKSPDDATHSYRVRFADGFEAALTRREIVMLARFKEGELALDEHPLERNDLFERVIFRCVIGSRAYGLDNDQSDTDRRGVYLPRAEQHWSLFGIPEQLENDESQEVYWEIEKFLVLALKANPNILECLYSPLVEMATPLGQELIDLRECFLSRCVYQTFNGYVVSQFRKMQGDLRNHGEVKWKHVMHLIRLLLSGITTLREGFVPTRVTEHRDALLAIKRGEMPWGEADAWRLRLHDEFNKAYERTKLPDRPDYIRANMFLLRARRAALLEQLP